MTNPGPGGLLLFGQACSGDFNVWAMRALHLPPRRKTLASRPGVQEYNAMKEVALPKEPGQLRAVSPECRARLHALGVGGKRGTRVPRRRRCTPTLSRE